MNKIIAFVPAKGSSSRVPNKNIRDIGGIPLFLRACYNLHQVLPKESIILDSDNRDYIKIAEEHGFKSVVRPDSLATNATDGNAFFRWETSCFPDADIYIQHLPPMPFCSKETLERGLDAILKEGYDSIVTVGKEHFYLWDADSSRPLYDVKQIPNSYTIKETMFETMGLYMVTRKAHERTGLRIGEKYKIIEINKIEQIDINYPEDFDLAEAVANGVSRDSCYNTKNLMDGRGK